MSNLFLFTSEQLKDRYKKCRKILRQKIGHDNITQKEYEDNKCLFKEIKQIENILEERGDL
jgi:hypothetical protein